MLTVDDELLDAHIDVLVATSGLKDDVLRGNRGRLATVVARDNLEGRAQPSTRSDAQSRAERESNSAQTRRLSGPARK